MPWPASHARLSTRRPASTRDVVTVRTAFGGWPVELADTAGIRRTEDPLESLGIARSRREQQSADLVLLVLDRSEPLQPIDHDLIEANPGALLVVNKSDLPPAWDHEVARRILGLAKVSAERGEGLEELIATVVRRLVPDPPDPGSGPLPHRSARGPLPGEGMPDRGELRGPALATQSISTDDREIRGHSGPGGEW